jgi:hypothetical protein
MTLQARDIPGGRSVDSQTKDFAGIATLSTFLRSSALTCQVRDILENRYHLLESSLQAKYSCYQIPKGRGTVPVQCVDCSDSVQKLVTLIQIFHGC